MHPLTLGVPINSEPNQVKKYQTSKAKQADRSIITLSLVELSDHPEVNEISSSFLLAIIWVLLK